MFGLDYNLQNKNIDKLPDYPIPTLDETMTTYLDWLRPLVDEGGFQEAQDSIYQLLQSEASGILEKKLNQLGTKANDSWIYDYWIKAHLDTRAPLTPHTNVPILYENNQIKEFDNVMKAAIIMHTISVIYLEQRLNPEYSYVLNNKRYSTDQFNGLLASINHIQVDSDSYYINNKISEYIVLSFKNRLYKLRMIDSDVVVPLGKILNTIKKIMLSEEPSTCVNYLTVEPDRNKAGLILSELLEREMNQTSYQTIKDAIIVFNLDSSSPNTMVEKLDCASYCSTDVNRWHGKGLQFSLTANGHLSFIADHAFVDGGTELYLIEKMSQLLEKSSFEVETNEMTTFENLKFDTSGYEDRLIQMKKNFDVCMTSFTTRVVNLDFSREQLKRNGVLSADGFAHMAFQRAQKLTFDKIYNTYISVDNRSYFRGRTECNRPVTAESKYFVESVTHNNDNLKDLLFKALDEHYHRTQLCKAGKGVNRYLFVLEELYKENKNEIDPLGLITFFKTNAYKTMCENRLSTTSFTHKDIKGLYFPPVQDDGFGIYYVIGDESYGVITAYNDYADELDQYINHLETAIKEMNRIIE